MGRCRSVGFLKSFLSCASQLSEASILVFFDFSHASDPSAQRLRVVEWWHLLNCRPCFLFWEPSFTFGSPKTLMAGHACLLLWEEMFVSQSLSTVGNSTICERLFMTFFFFLSRHSGRMSEIRRKFLLICRFRC